MIQKFEGWRQKYQHHSSWLWRQDLKLSKSSQFIRNSSFIRYRHLKRPIKLRNWFIVLIFSIVTLTSVVGYRFYNQPQLTVGKIAPLTIKAPYSAQFEDTKTTLEKRQDVQTGIVPILKQNENLTVEITNNLTSYLESVDKLRKLTEPFPFFAPQALSISSQKYFRFCPESEFRAILASVNQAYDQDNVYNDRNTTLETRPNFNFRLQQTAAELQAYRAKTSATEFNTLIAQITLTRYRYARAWKKLSRQRIARLDTQEISILLDLTEQDWKVTKDVIFLAVERILTQGISEGMPSNL
ncbi:MAG: hypothetical protein ACRC06_04095, partial [Waterburya sp.]